MIENDALTLPFLPSLTTEVRQLANRYAMLLYDRGVVDLHSKDADKLSRATAQTMVISIALCKLSYLTAHDNGDAASLTLADKIQRDLIAQMVSCGFWISPWAELVNQEFPGSVPTSQDIAAYEMRAQAERVVENQRVTKLIAWCGNVRDQLESYDYDFQPVDIDVIQLLAVRWMVTNQRSARHDRQHARDLIRGASRADHPAWTIVLDAHFPEA